MIFQVTKTKIIIAYILHPLRNPVTGIVDIIIFLGIINTEG